MSGAEFSSRIQTLLYPRNSAVRFSPLACCHFLALWPLLFCTTDLPLFALVNFHMFTVYSQHKLKQESKITQMETILSNSELTISFSSKGLANFVSFFNFFCLWSLETLKTEVNIKIICCRKLFKSFMCVFESKAVFFSSSNLIKCRFLYVLNWNSIISS